MILGNNVCLSVTSNINTTLNMVNIYELLLKEIFHCPLVVNHWRSQSFPWFIQHDLRTKITLIWTNKITRQCKCLKFYPLLVNVFEETFLLPKKLSNKENLLLIHCNIFNKIYTTKNTKKNMREIYYRLYELKYSKIT